MKNSAKVIIATAIITAVVAICVISMNKKNPEASQRRVDGYAELDENKYPGYKEKLSVIEAEHPNWSFTILYTGLNWDDVIFNESEGNDGINLVDASNEKISSGEWICEANSEKIYQEPSWKCASKLGVAYQMDPRNFLNAEDLFQFETLSFVDDMYSIEGIEKILENSFMHDVTIRDFYAESIPGNNFSDKKFSEVIMETAEKLKVSPYHLASRMVQGNIAMVGDANTPMDAVRGTIEGFEGLFNFFNIGSKTSGDNARDRGLYKAKEENWTTPEQSIEAGADYIAENYIKKGQDTLYLQKFDVIDNEDGLYKHQYMQNLQGAASEGAKTFTTYNGNGMLSSKFNFIIPVYEEMPKETKSPL